MTQIVDKMRQALAATDPDLDTSAGTTTRKILDAVGESIAEVFLDQHMLHYQYDVDSKTAGDLDTFTQVIGGIARLVARRATGSVTFSVGSPSVKATTMVTIPFGTQIRSNQDSSVVVATVTGGAIMPGENNITLPVQAVIAGPSGNVAANSLTQIISPLDGIASVSNASALTGGAEQESDAELRARWKQTVFRSMAGTESMYLATAYNNTNVTGATLLGAALRRYEQVQPYIPTSGKYNGQLIAQSTAPDVAYAYTNDPQVGGDIANGHLMALGTEYTFDTSTMPPTIVFNSTSQQYDTGQVDANGKPVYANVNGGVLDLQYRYVPSVSRNDPNGSRFGKGSVLSKVDLIVAGQRPVAVSQSLTFTNQLRFGTPPSSGYSPLSNTNFVRADGTNPTVNNVFIPLAFGPIISVPDILTVGSSTYGRIGANVSGVTYPNSYQVVHEATCFGYGYNSQYGLEWVSTQIPSSGQTMSLGANSSYVYNATPSDVQSAVEQWRLVGTDVLVHGSITRYVRVSYAIMYDRNVTRSDVDQAVQTALSTFLSQQGLGSTLQCSDVVAVIHGVSGVDNVRLLDASDYSDWTYANANTYNTGLQLVVNGAVTKTYITAGGHLQDAIFKSNESPTLESIRPTVRAQNTFQAS